MRPTLATAAKRRWQKLPENSRAPGPYRARCVASRRQPRSQARTSLAIAASHALIWPIVGKRLGGDDVRRSLGSARIELTREVRVDMAKMHLGRSWEFASLHLSRCDRRIPLFSQDMVGERFERSFRGDARKSSRSGLKWQGGAQMRKGRRE